MPKIYVTKKEYKADIKVCEVSEYKADIKYWVTDKEHKSKRIDCKWFFVDKEHTKGWDASDFFDILDNSWNLEGVGEALNKGKAKCEGGQ